MGLAEGIRAIFINAPAEAIQAIDLPAINCETTLSGNFDYIHLFANNQADLHEKLPTLKNHLAQTGTLWVSWPKARQKWNGPDTPESY